MKGLISKSVSSYCGFMLERLRVCCCSSWTKGAVTLNHIVEEKHCLAYGELFELLLFTISVPPAHQ